MERRVEGHWLNEPAVRPRRMPHISLGIALTVALAALLFAINAAQITSPTTGRHIHERTVAILTEIDDLLPRVYPAWQEEARTTNEAWLPVPNFPIQVQVVRDDILSLPRQELQELVVREAADRLYREGLGVLALEGTPQLRSFSSQGAVHRGLGLISDEMYKLSRVVAAVAGAAAIAIAAVLVAPRSGFRRLSAVGAAVLGAAVPSLLAAVALRSLFSLLADGQHDIFASALLKLGEEIMAIPVRNYVLFSLLGAALMVVGFALSRAESAIGRPSSPQASAGRGVGTP